MKITAAKVIFKTLVFKFGKFKCFTRNKKHTDQCFTLPDSIRITLHVTRVTLRLAFHHNVTFFPAEFIRKGCRETDRYPRGPCPAQAELCVYRGIHVTQASQTSDKHFFPTSLAINCTHILRHVPICILSFFMLELFQVWMKAPNCVKSSLELIHFTARMKKLLKCQQSTKCPSHTSS